MATTERDQAAVSPSDCELGSLVMDIATDKVGVVMGHYGGDRVQVRPIKGGAEWDAFRVRPLTAREELSARNAARNAATRQGL
ncbi:hypothetical protein ELB20_50 [Streptomyces phage phiELB20]|uniref:Uncharacterized protein n=1 Tax=Streptomyces phage phiELB20 TaxID=1211278 RepID=I7A9K0_9CAUD|nr:hypothetical protein FDG59_gp34 [Streptomyces phage phiELB20]AFO10916.1 hypothetical protein ELB20_50 [Streptomyces phage phiELB20]